jgi:hypothetical protein
LRLNSPIRTLDGVTYWVIEDANAIYDFMNAQLRQEWIGDAKDEGRDPGEDVWLLGLSKREWRLEILELKAIKPNPYEFIPRTGYNFEGRLADRSKELRRVIEKYGSVIWPVTVRGEDMQLVDGYCRFTTLKIMGVPRVYAYVGRLHSEL